MSRRRPVYIEAVAVDHPDATGLNVVASYQTIPTTDRPFKIAGRADTAKTQRRVVIALTLDEARKLVRDFQSFGA